jgi:hypothetical protein
MNIFLFELRRAWKSAAIWTAALLAFLTVMIEGVYPLFLESRGAVEAALEGFPPEFSAAFGMRMDDLFSLGGFYSFCFLYVCIMGRSWPPPPASTYFRARSARNAPIF